jgi:hypothetical protein
LFDDCHSNYDYIASNYHDLFCFFNCNGRMVLACGMGDYFIMGNTTVIILQNDQVDWYSKHPERLINAIIARMNSGELDRYPGYARWDGDGIPGMQLVWNENSSTIGIIAVGRGSGQRLAAMNNGDNSNTDGNKLALLKAFAARLGYNITKKSTQKNKNNKNHNNNNAHKRSPRSK